MVSYAHDKYVTQLHDNVHKPAQYAINAVYIHAPVPRQKWTKLTTCRCIRPVNQYEARPTMALVRNVFVPASPQNMLMEIQRSTDVTWCHQKAGMYNLQPRVEDEQDSKTKLKTENM